MKKFFVSLVLLAFTSAPVKAESPFEKIQEVELELQAAALVTFNQMPSPDPKGIFAFDLAKSFDFLKDLQSQLQGVKEMLISSYDENGNGKIDPGTEFDNFKAGLKMLLTLTADKNQNGKIDAEDIAVLTKDALAKVRSDSLTNFCPFVHQQADFAGIFLKFNPLLSHFENVCNEHDLTVQGS